MSRFTGETTIAWSCRGSTGECQTPTPNGGLAVLTKPLDLNFLLAAAESRGEADRLAVGH